MTKELGKRDKVPKITKVCFDFSLEKRGNSSVPSIHVFVISPQSDKKTNKQINKCYSFKVFPKHSTLEAPGEQRAVSRGGNI